MSVYRKTTKVVPEEAVVVPESIEESFECDAEGCDHVSDSKAQAIRHYAKEHAVVERKDVGHKIFLRFETEEAFGVFHEVNPERHNNLRWADFWDHNPVWCGPGWYYVRAETRPCGRGCCTNRVAELIPVEQRIGRLREKIDAHEEMIRLVESELGVQEILSCCDCDRQFRRDQMHRAAGENWHKGWFCRTCFVWTEEGTADV